MDEQFWRDVWKQEHQGFHEGQPNSYLVRHTNVLRGNQRVLVPLCGKSQDLIYLRDQNFDVVGIELVESAARAFFAEQGLHATESTHNGHIHLSADGITIIVANVLDVTKQEAGRFDVIYDRAAAVALPPEMRRAYADALNALLTDDGHIFLVTFMHPMRTAGPPFSISRTQVADMYPTAPIKVLEHRSPTHLEQSNPDMAWMGVDVYWLGPF